MNVKRPKRVHEEDEDELMEFQEQFLKQELKPSVHLVRKKHQNDLPDVKEQQFKVESN